MSCGSQNVAKHKGIVLSPSENQNVEIDNKISETHKPGVKVTTDNKSRKKNALHKVSFMGYDFDVPVSEIEEYKIAIILPFNFNKSGRINEQLKEISLEYFEGVEIALKELENRGINVHTEVFDSKNDSLTTEELLKKDYFKNVNLIIGPVFENDFKVVERFCSVYGIPLVNPLKHYQKTNRTSAPVFNPVFVDSNRHYIAGLELINLFKSSEFLLFNDNSKDGYPVRRGFMKAFEEKHKSISYVTMENLKSKISSDKEIVIIAPVNEDKTVYNILNAVSGKKNIKVVGIEEWFDFPIIPFGLWEKCNLLFYNNNNVNQLDEEIAMFNEYYNEEFGGVPGKLSYIAYDQTLFFVEALSAFGQNFGEYFNGYTFPVSHSSFRFVKMSNGSYENYFINILRLNEEFDLEKIN